MMFPPPFTCLRTNTEPDDEDRALEDYLASAASPRRCGLEVCMNYDATALGFVFPDTLNACPCSDNEHDDYRDEEDEQLTKVWDLEPEQVAEQRVLGAGGFVGVRRVVSVEGKDEAHGEDEEHGFWDDAIYCV